MTSEGHQVKILTALTKHLPGRGGRHLADRFSSLSKLTGGWEGWVLQHVR